MEMMGTAYIHVKEKVNANNRATSKNHTRTVGS